MNKSSSVLMIGLSTMLLAGCATTGGGAGGGGGGPSSPALFAIDAGTAAEALDNGETLHAYNSLMSSSLEHDSDESETRAIDSLDFSIKTNAQGGVDVTIDGQTQSFASGDQIQWGWEKDSGADYFGVNSWSGNDVDDVMDPTNTAHHQVWRYWWDPGTGVSNSGFAVVGTETMPAALAGKANATYSGDAVAFLYDENTFQDDIRVRGDLAMQADFNAGSIAGQITSLEVIGGAGLAGSVSMDSTAISGNGFTGNLTVSPDALGAFGLANLGGTYGGKFFGATGQEVGGVLSLTGEDTVGNGFFSGTQD